MQRVQLKAAQVISKVVQGGRNLKNALKESLEQQTGFSARERRALQDLCYGTLRHYARLRYMLDELLQRPVPEFPLRDLMLVALYQLQYTRAPHHAIVDQAVRAAKRQNAPASGLVNGVLRNFLRREQELRQKADAEETSRYSYPAWWIERIKVQYGAQAEAILEAGNGHPPMTLRINRRRSDLAAYAARLAEQKIAAREIAPEALRLERPVPVDRLPGFFEGEVSVQDVGAQYAAHFLEVEAGMRVLDACAAPGGKSGHILELADVDLWALDRNEQRLEQVHDNLRRLGLQATVRRGDALAPQSWWDGRPFHRILADVPCSASGVVRRHPDIKWLRQPGDIEELARQQLAILEALWPLLAVGGKLLYATCSVFAEENEGVVTAFLARHADAVRIERQAPDMKQGQLLPNDEHDGFFYALLQKQV